MTVTILKGQKEAVDSTGTTYSIHAGEILVKNMPSRLYPTGSSFFKAAWPSGTKHPFRKLDNGKINVQ